MFLQQIKLTNFRNYASLNLKLKNGINIFYGNNAQGKTNILESIYFLGLTKSHRTNFDNELVMNEKEGFKLEGIIKNDKIKTNLCIKYFNKTKNLYVDNNMKSDLFSYLYNMNVIIFYPDDIEIIKGMPEIRRKFLNTELSQLYPAYLKILNDYNKILKIRNSLLKKLSNKESIDMKYFNILNNYYIDKAVFLYRARKKFLDKISYNSSNIYKDIINIDDFKIKYITKPNFINYDEEYLKLELKKIMNNNFNDEVRLGVSLYGPHRDDFDFILKDNNLKKYGSQGQQKLSVLVLKLSEISIFENHLQSKPILLLDDVFSEFDRIKKNNILKYIQDDIQTIITTTDLNNISKDIKLQSKIFFIKDGNVIEK